MTTTRSRRTLTLSVAQCRAVDNYAIETLGVPGVVLMENAGRNAADLIEGWLRARTRGRSSPGRVAIVCGRGNNGGDGFVIARQLVNRGWQVQVDLAADPAALAVDAAVNHVVADRMGVPIRPLRDRRSLGAAARRWRECDAIVDALLGTGFAGQVREPLAGVIERINGLSAKGPLVVAIDVPSGLNADTGEVGGVAVRADRTITFLAVKTGYVTRSARACLGRVSVVDIGVPTARILSQLA